MNNHSEPLQLMQAKFPSDNVSCCVKANLIQEFKTVRYLVIVSWGHNSAIFILSSGAVPPTSTKDLVIEWILPIDEHFRCDIESDFNQEDTSDISLNICSNKRNFIFELGLGEASNMFVGEIYKATERLNRQNRYFDHGWLKKYHSTYKNKSNDEEGIADPIMDSLDMLLPRESLATGKCMIPDRDTIIRYEMKKFEREYTDYVPLRVFVGTWNVNGQPASVSLQEWLSCDVDPPDIYAIGFQELDLSKEAYLFTDSIREENWRLMVEKGLHNGAQYKEVKLVRLVGMMLIVYVQEQYDVMNVAVDRVGTGIMGKMGNKGGVSVRMEIYNTSMCFVNSHLAAHVEEYERRNQDYNEICSRTSFTAFTPPKAIKDHDQVYWLGDLNYRITGLDVNAVKEYILMEKYKPILENDQLVKQHRLKKVFVGYKEGPINFMPTYKYDPGTDNWDSSEKNRAPAWCDRILWKGDSIQQLEYRSHQIYQISDHKPVSSVFISRVKRIDEIKYNMIRDERLKVQDKIENEFQPQATVDNTEIKFNTINFMEPQSKEFTIANVGVVPVKFNFKIKLDHTNICKEWLSIEPFIGDINPGEKCDIKLEILVDKRSASKINSGKEKLEDILVLHFDGGKDIFITVTGEYHRSCFGSSLETLANLVVPINEVPPEKLAEMENNRMAYGHGFNSEHQIPKEIWFLIDHLHRYGMKQPLLFINAGLKSEFEGIRTWLDNWSLEPLPGSVYSVAESLLLLLESTAEPVIPYELHAKCLDASSNYTQCKQIVQQLPVISQKVFIYICLFLRELIYHSDDNGLDIKTISTLFGGIFLRDLGLKNRDQMSKSWFSQQSAQDKKKSTFVSHFLVNDDPNLYQLVAGV
ncbi:inositol polyphosphate 5-phosphatase OCRL-1 isoform X2 [Cimex lectularius]|uniref:phosphoinositide 5-phosphatase n=1 Tax=Cimex lectularius TaxID=79782 RepID=A0A8I6SD17_CIMLE|nr:inositol polyphosphate 5-phosphatase OCRL-1 isoform X2 [Cimex lectularius]